MRRSAIALTLGLSAGIVTAPAALADTPDTPSCLGVVTAQRAVAHHDIGDHASTQDEPRLGLGNVTRLLLGDDAHRGDLGALLGEIDETAAPAAAAGGPACHGSTMMRMSVATVPTLPRANRTSRGRRGPDVIDSPACSCPAPGLSLLACP